MICIQAERYLSIFVSYYLYFLIYKHLFNPTEWWRSQKAGGQNTWTIARHGTRIMWIRRAFLPAIGDLLLVLGGLDRKREGGGMW